MYGTKLDIKMAGFSILVISAAGCFLYFTGLLNGFAIGGLISLAATTGLILTNKSVARIEKSSLISLVAQAILGILMCFSASVEGVITPIFYRSAVIIVVAAVASWIIFKKYSDKIIQEQISKLEK